MNGNHDCPSLITARLRRFVADTRGATAVEYGLIVALLSVATIAALFTTGDGLKNTFSVIANTLKAM